MDEKYPIIVLASGNGSTFQAIVENCQHAKVEALVTDQPDCYAVERARKLGIRSYAASPDWNVPNGNQETKEAFNEGMVGLCEYAFDQGKSTGIPVVRSELIVLAGYMRILTPAFLKVFPRIVNIHPSLLPKYKGLNTYQRALDAGDKTHGTTVHQVTKNLDDGPILAQRAIPIHDDDTVDTLRERTQEAERILYPKMIDLVVTNQVGWIG